MYKFTPTKLSSASASSVSLAEIKFQNTGQPVSFAAWTATNPGGSEINPSTEQPIHAIDGSTSTKWLDFNKEPLIISSPTSVLIDKFTFVTANDSPGRDPVRWSLEASCSAAGP